MYPLKFKPLPFPLPQPLEHVQNQSGPLVPQHQPGMLHGAGELGQGLEGVQCLLGAESLGFGLSRQRLDLLDLVRL